MALSMNVTLPDGLVVNNACLRVDPEHVGFMSKTQMVFILFYRVDADKFPLPVPGGYICPYDIDGDNPIAQAYVYLKTLLEFEDAADC